MSKSTKAKPRLGRGLSSLISVSELPVEVDVSIPDRSSTAIPTSTNTSSPPDERDAGFTSRDFADHHSETPHSAVKSGSVDVPIDRIVPNPHQPRKVMDDARLTELAASIRSTGLIQPIVVRAIGPDRFELIAGERRWRAARLAELSTIPVLVRDVDGFTQAQMALIENIQREDLNPIDRAQGYRSLIDQLGLTQSELASRLGEDRSGIANYLRLLDLADPVKSMLRDGTLSVGHAKLLAGVSDPVEQQRLAGLCVTQDLSVRNLERLLQNPAAPMPERVNTAARSPHVLDLEKNLTRQLGMRVQVRTTSKKGRGRLVIHYATLDQFDELLQRLGVNSEE